MLAVGLGACIRASRNCVAGKHSTWTGITTNANTACIDCGAGAYSAAESL